uniref:Vitellogenin domain-containing protein n=1 Tax=Glossina palpalis gambiensis TaxID=67801 RepID=A0A1B0BIE9_9MUSC
MASTAVVLYILICLFSLSKVIKAESNCNNSCTEDENLFKYRDGHVYEYVFDSAMAIGIKTSDNSQNDDTSMRISGVAKIFVEPNCGYTLQIGSFKVSAAEAIQKKIMQNIQKPVHFTMVNGKLNAELCVADAGENSYSLNIKRAIISMFQSNPDAKYEIDVFGECPTRSSVAKVGSIKIVNKSRNLNSCVYRQVVKSSFLRNIVNIKSGSSVNTNALLDASFAKESKIENGIISSIEVTEEYTFGKKVVGKTGLTVCAKVKTGMRVKSLTGSPSTAPVYGSRSASIIFQEPETYTAKNTAAVKAIFGELMEHVEDHVKLGSANGFVELIRLMRASDTDVLMELSAFPHQKQDLARRVYLDALFRTGTSESARAIIKQFNKMTEKEKTIAMEALKSVEIVDRDTLNLAANLINPNAPKETYLALGMMVSNFCTRNSCHQGEIDMIFKKISDVLKKTHCKANTRNEENRLLFLLKGIENAKHLAKMVNSSLLECVSEGRSNRIRIAALQAFSSADCDISLQKKAMELLSDHNEDSEIRIKAFLAVIKCPSGEAANELTTIVNSEPVHQVGGFITSTLKLIRDSADESRSVQREHFANIRITKKFPIDLRRYSYHGEFSENLLGSSVNYKLIYSQTGFLPRSSALDIKTKILGFDLNVFETTLRMENIENILQFLMGPKGVINENRNSMLKLDEYTHPAARKRRSIVDEAAKAAKRYKTYGSKFSSDVNLDISLKLFGSEMMFLSLGDDLPNSFEDIYKQISFAIDKIKNELGSYGKEFINHDLFMDTTFNYPTALGVPLELSLQGFAASKVNFAIAVDIDSMFVQGAYLNKKYKCKIEPSIDVNLMVGLGFNAYVLSTGVSTSVNMHSATGNAIELAFIHEGAGINMEFEMPRDKIEFINIKVTHSFYIQENDKPIDKRLILNRDNKDPNGIQMERCYNQLESLGIKPCVSRLGSLKPGDDATLPSEFIFSFHVMSVKKFNIKGYRNNAEVNVEQWKLDYSTPEGAHDTSLTVEIGTKSRFYGRVCIENMKQHYALEAGVSNNNHELVIYVQHEKGKDIKKSKVGFMKSGNEYRPVIEIRKLNGGFSDELNGYKVDGRVIVASGDGEGATKKYNFNNLQVMDKENEGMIINGWANIGKTSLNTQLFVKIPKDSTYTVEGNFEVSEVYSAGFFISDANSPDHIYGASTSIRVIDQLVNISILANYAKYEFAANNELEYIKQGDNPSISSSKFANSVSLKCSEKNLIFLKLSGLTEGENKFEIVADMNIQGQKKKKNGSLSVKFAAHQRAKNDYSLSIYGKLNDNFVDLTAVCDVTGNQYNWDNSLSTSLGTLITLKGKINQSLKLIFLADSDVVVDLQGTTRFSNKDSQSKWNLKINGAEDKTIVDFNFLKNKEEVVKLNFEKTISEEKLTAAEFNLLANDFLDVKVDFKVSKIGKGELVAVIESPKHKKQVEVNSNFHLQNPKYDVEVLLVCDKERKFFVKSDNVLDRTAQIYRTKNIMQSGGKETSFDANTVIKGSSYMDGDIDATFVFTSSEGRILDGTFKQKMTTNIKTGLTHGIAEINLSDNLSNNGPKQSLILMGKVDKVDIKKKEFLMNFEILYTNLLNQKLQIIAQTKNLAKQKSNAAIHFSTKVSGDLTESPITASFIVDEFSPAHAVLKWDFKYGSEIQTHCSCNYHVSELDKPTTYAIQMQVQKLNSTWKTFELSSKGQYQNNKQQTFFELALDEKLGSGDFLRFNTASKILTNKSANALLLFEIASNRMEPLKIEAKSEHATVSDEGSTDGEVLLSLNYGSQFGKITSKYKSSKSEIIKHSYFLDTSFDAMKSLEININIVSGYHWGVEVKHNEEPYAVDLELFGGKPKRGFDMKITLPNANPILVVVIHEILDSHKFKLQMDIQNFLNLDFKLNSEASYNNSDDFYLVARWSSARLQLNNYDLMLRTENKVLNIELKHTQNTVFKGAISYAISKENHKYIYEGQGQIEHRGTTKTGNFKLISEVYELATDKEIGFAYTFSGNVGGAHGVSTVKMTNKDLILKLSICEEKKQCTNAQLLASNDMVSENSNIQSLLILLDLRELGFPYELELQSKNTRDGFKFRYILDMKVMFNSNLNYQLLITLQPSNGKVQLKLPTREMLLEMHQQYPQAGQLMGHYKSSLSLYTNKSKKPNEVIRLLAQADISGSDWVSLNLKSLLKFEHPAIQPCSISTTLEADRNKELVDLNIVFDVFKLPEYQVVISSRLENIALPNGFNITAQQTLSSDGFDIQYQSAGHAAFNVENKELSLGGELINVAGGVKSTILFLGSPTKIEILAYGLNEELLKLIISVKQIKPSTKIHGKLQVLGTKAIEMTSELQFGLAKLNVERAEFLHLDVLLAMGKELKLKANEAGKELISVTVNLNPSNFLDSTFIWNKRDIEEFVEGLQHKYKEESSMVLLKMKERYDTSYITSEQDLINKIRANVIDFKELRPNIGEILKEVEHDSALKQLLEIYHEFEGKLLKFVEESRKLLHEISEKTTKTVQYMRSKFKEMFHDVIVPAIQNTTEDVLIIFKLIFNTFADVVVNSFDIFFKVFSEYEPMVKEYGKVVAELLKPSYEAAEELYKFSLDILDDLPKNLQEHLTIIKDLQLELKRMFKKLRFEEKIFKFLNCILEELSLLPLNADILDLLRKLQEYTSAKLTNDPVNDKSYAEEFLHLLLKTLRSSLVVDAFTITTSKLPWDNIFFTYPSSFNIFDDLPNLLTFRVSVLNFIFNENFEYLLSRDFWRSVIFFEGFHLSGHLTEGRHLFTFDGVYVNLNGNCKYILSQDSLNNNFSVIAQVNNKLKSLYLTDREGQFLELNDAGVLKFNGNPVEFPLHENGMHAWRLHYTIYLHSEYGVSVMCTAHLKVCHIDVNGFYKSKLRGLLGNGNAEPFDDFTQMDGTIARNTINFLQGYGLGKCNVASLTVNVNNMSHTDICNHHFGYKSPLAIGYLIKDPILFKAACDQAVASVPDKDKETAACNIALTYASVIKKKLDHTFIFLPQRCLKCGGAPGQRDLFEDFIVKTPESSADIVFVVDVDVSDKQMTNLIAPVIPEIRKALKVRGFTDVQIVVIAFSSGQRYPAILTSDQGKLNYHGNLANDKKKLKGPKPLFSDFNISETALTTDKTTYILEMLEKFLKNLVPKSDEVAFNLALDYPFRPGAAKTIVAVYGNELPYDNFLTVLRAHLSNLATDFNGALLHVITPVKGMSLEGVEAEKLIGFNSRLVATLDGKDAKKRQKLQYESSKSIDFVLNKGGWIFDMQNFEELKPPDHIKVLNQVANSIADTLFKTEMVSKCSCMPIYGIHSQHKCVVKSTHFVANKKVKS